MKEIIVIAEHRRGELRDVTWEMLSKGRQLAESLGAEVGVALLGKGVSQLAEALKSKAHRVFFIEDNRLEAFNSEAYEKVLTQLITERKPILTLIGHTAMGMDFAPSLATHLKNTSGHRLYWDRCDRRNLLADPTTLCRKGQCDRLLFEARPLYDNSSCGCLSRIGKRSPSG